MWQTSSPSVIFQKRHCHYYDNYFHSQYYGKIHYLCQNSIIIRTMANIFIVSFVTNIIFVSIMANNIKNSVSIFEDNKHQLKRQNYLEYHATYG